MAGPISRSSIATIVTSTPPRSRTPPRRRSRHSIAAASMFVTLAGAMSTAELGVSLAEMIRQGKVHGICCTGANLEEDVFNLVAHDHYERMPHYRDLTPADEQALLDRHMNRVTDTCIPEHEAMRRIETRRARRVASPPTSAGERYFPHEFLYRVLRSGKLEAVLSDRSEGQLADGGGGAEPADVRARLGGLDARQHVRRPLHRGRRQERAHRAHRHRVHDGARRLVHERRSRTRSIGFFQIGGGIAGDFPICVVPMLHQDLQRTTCRSGATSARSAIRRRATARTRAPSRTRRSPGASSASTRPSSSSSRTPRSSRR